MALISRSLTDFTTGDFANVDVWKLKGPPSLTLPIPATLDFSGVDAEK